MKKCKHCSRIAPSVCEADESWDGQLTKEEEARYLELDACTQEFILEFNNRFNELKEAILTRRARIQRKLDARRASGVKDVPMVRFPDQTIFVALVEKPHKAKEVEPIKMAGPSPMDLLLQQLIVPSDKKKVN